MKKIPTLFLRDPNNMSSVTKRRNPTREEKARGQEPGYTTTDRDNPADKHIFAAVDATDFSNWPDGAWSCEALGPKIQGGVESNVPALYPFSWSPEVIETGVAISYDIIKAYLEQHEIEGIVWHEQTGEKRMAKIKRRDFNLSWPPKRKVTVTLALDNKTIAKMEGVLDAK